MTRLRLLNKFRQDRIISLHVTYKKQRNTPRSSAPVTMQFNDGD